MWSAGNHGRINRLKGHGVIHQPIPLGVRSTPLVLSLSIIGAHSQLFQDTLWTGHHSVTLIRVKHMWWHTVVHIFPLSCQWFVFLRFIFLCVFAIKLENRWIIESLILIITTGIQSDSVSRVEMEMWCLEADRNQYDYLADPGPTDNLVMAFSSEQTVFFLTVFTLN